MNKPHKLLFFLPSFRIGGITLSLYSLLYAIDPQIINAYIYAGAYTGEYKDKMPNCTEMQGNWLVSRSSEGLGMRDRVLHKIKMLLKSISKPLGLDIDSLFFRMADKKLRLYDFDAIVCFSEEMAAYCSKLPAKKKIAWIHCDYSRHLAISESKTEERAAYGRYDKIVCVSNFVKDVFSELYPQYADKVYAIHNVINVEDIRKKAQETIDDSRFITDNFTIVSCGRLDPVKQFSLIPGLAAQLKDKGAKPFKWYIIGGGFTEEQNRIEAEITKYHMEDVVILLGSKTNAYPYLSNADLYVCTSESESFPLVVNEAKALSVPIIANNFPSVYESVEEGVDGYVVPIDTMPEKIADFMASPLKMSDGRIDNTESLNAIYKLFEA